MKLRGGLVRGQDSDLQGWNTYLRIREETSGLECVEKDVPLDGLRVTNLGRSHTQNLAQNNPERWTEAMMPFCVHNFIVKLFLPPNYRSERPLEATGPRSTFPFQFLLPYKS
jgi:hypothetical protein